MSRENNKIPWSDIHNYYYYACIERLKTVVTTCMTFEFIIIEVCAIII